jgi:hypothetical protein
MAAATAHTLAVVIIASVVLVVFAVFFCRASRRRVVETFECKDTNVKANKYGILNFLTMLDIFNARSNNHRKNDADDVRPSPSIHPSKSDTSAAGGGAEDDEDDDDEAEEAVEGHFGPISPEPCFSKQCLADMGDDDPIARGMFVYRPFDEYAVDDLSLMTYCYYVPPTETPYCPAFVGDNAMVFVDSNDRVTLDDVRRWKLKCIYAGDRTKCGIRKVVCPTVCSDAGVIVPDESAPARCITSSKIGRPCKVDCRGEYDTAKGCLSPDGALCGDEGAAGTIQFVATVTDVNGGRPCPGPSPCPLRPCQMPSPSALPPPVELAWKTLIGPEDEPIVFEQGPRSAPFTIRIEDVTACLTRPELVQNDMYETSSLSLGDGFVSDGFVIDGTQRPAAITVKPNQTYDEFIEDVPIVLTVPDGRKITMDVHFEQSPVGVCPTKCVNGDPKNNCRGRKVDDTTSGDCKPNTATALGAECVDTKTCVVECQYPREFTRPPCPTDCGTTASSPTVSVASTTTSAICTPSIFTYTCNPVTCQFTVAAPPTMRVRGRDQAIFQVTNQVSPAPERVTGLTVVPAEYASSIVNNTNTPLSITITGQNRKATYRVQYDFVSRNYPTSTASFNVEETVGEYYHHGKYVKWMRGERKLSNLLIEVITTTSINDSEKEVDALLQGGAQPESGNITQYTEYTIVDMRWEINSNPDYVFKPLIFGTSKPCVRAEASDWLGFYQKGSPMGPNDNSVFSNGQDFKW